MRRIILLVVFATAFSQTYSQSITGSWYGKAIPQLGGVNSNNYLTELQIRQKGDEVEGVLGYYFRDQYQSFYVRGEYDAKSRELIIRNIPMPYFRSSAHFSIDCPMNLALTLMVSQVSKTLKGYFYSQEEYKNTCGDLSVQFTLDATDFSYDSTFRAGFSSKKIWKPGTDDIVLSGSEIKAEKIATDSAASIAMIETPSSEESELLKKFNQRKNIISETITVRSDSLRVSLYDNGDIDGDSITVFFNKVPVIISQPLTARALTVYCSLDTTREFNEISMYAENLGKYPPNTALLVISDGYNNYEVFLSSTLSQNATVRIRRKKD